jgi:DNA-binding SARP family transcriptional activator/tetratricopeptide (TPR) repeat protein
MWLGVLGPLCVRHGGVVIEVPAAKQRVILAALLTRPGQLVPVDVLAEIAWDGSPPPGARATVRNYVMRLRHVLGPAVDGRIVTRHPGYLIEIGRDEADLLSFAELCRAGGEAARKHAWQQSSEVLGRALALWRGTPLSDVPSQVLQAAEVPRLEAVRLQALEWRASADLALGRHAEVLTEIQALAAQFPLREHLHALVMLALYRAGRQADALAAYQQTRRILVDELGVEPGPELRSLQQRMLTGDPSLQLPDPPSLSAPGRPATMLAGPSPRAAPPARTPPAARPVPLVPRQLPPGTARFAGRQAELRALSKLVGEARRPEGALLISAIGGMAGVGKTALALQWAHQIAARFPDGQLYLDLRGFDPSGTPVSTDEAVGGFLNALGVPADQIPASLAQRTGLYRSLLAGRRMLILLDNARDPSQVRPLLPGSRGCLVVVTSRSQLTGLVAVDGANLLTLDVLTEHGARELLSRHIGPDRVAAEPGPIGELIGLCAQLPLALAVAAARAVARPGFTIAALSAELRCARTPLDALDSGGDPAASARTVFSWSYQNLSARAARFFRLLGLHPGPGITVPAAASLTGASTTCAQHALAELTAAHLLTEQIPGRYTFNDLMRAYASEHARSQHAEPDRRAATHRVLDHYRQSARTASQLLYPARDQIDDIPAPLAGVTPESFADHAEAFAWFDAEHHVLVAAIKLAAAQGLHDCAWQLAWAMETYCYRKGQWRDWAATQRIALTSASRLGHRGAKACAHRGIANASIELGHYTEALDHLRHALGLWEQLGDLAGVGRVELDMGRMYGKLGLHRAAARHEQRALGVFRALGHRSGQASALNHLGWTLAQLGGYQQALSCCQEAIGLLHTLGDYQNEAPTWDSLGYAHGKLGNHAMAAYCYQRAVKLFDQLGHRYSKAETLTDAGDAYWAGGDQDAARRAWQQALAVLDELQHPDAGRVRARLRRLSAAHPT